MSNSCSDCFSDLLCTEEPELLAEEDLSDETVPDLISAVDFDDFIAGLLEDERKYLPGIEYIQRYETDQPLEASAREKSVQWILKVQRYFGFQPMTAYLAVSYLDRFLNARGLQADTSGGWPMQLLSVACLSLATKLEETAVPLLSQLQVEDVSLMFDSVSIERMEVLILRTLDWRLRSVTPFHFITIFAHKLDSAGYYTDFLIARATDLISSNMKDVSFLEYWPSCIAAAAILYVARDVPRLSFANVEHSESWSDALDSEKILGCYRLTEQVENEKRPLTRSKVVPQVRIMSSRARARPTVAGYYNINLNGYADSQRNRVWYI